MFEPFLKASSTSMFVWWPNIKYWMIVNVKTRHCSRFVDWFDSLSVHLSLLLFKPLLVNLCLKSPDLNLPRLHNLLQVCSARARAHTHTHTHTERSVFHTVTYENKHVNINPFCPLSLSEQRWMISVLWLFLIFTDSFSFTCLQQSRFLIKCALAIVEIETN